MSEISDVRERAICSIGTRKAPYPNVGSEDSRIADVKSSSCHQQLPILSSHNVRVFIINKSKSTMKQFSSVHKGGEKKEEPTEVEHKASYLKLAYESAMDVQKSRNCYDTHAELYETVHSDGSWVGPRLLAEQVALRLQDSDSQSAILDFGAGTGLLGRALAQNKIAATIEAADLSKDMLDIAQKTSDGIYTNFHIGLLNEDFTLENNYYDAVVSSGVIGTHVGFECVEEIMPSVKKGGFIAFTILKEANESFFSGHYETMSPEWKVEAKIETGPLNVDIPNVEHNIMILKRN